MVILNKLKKMTLEINLLIRQIFSNFKQNFHSLNHTLDTKFDSDIEIMKRSENVWSTTTFKYMFIIIHIINCVHREKNKISKMYHSFSIIYFWNLITRTYFDFYYYLFLYILLILCWCLVTHVYWISVNIVVSVMGHLVLDWVR